MKTTLFIPDLHLCCDQAQKIIKSAGADEVVFLGDFFDEFYDSPEQFHDMIDWLEWAVTQPNFKFIYGNHDTHYAFPENHWRCSGYEQWKHFLVRDRLPRQWFEKHFQFYCIVDDTWLVTHAGLHTLNLPEKIAALHTDRSVFLKEIAAYLDEEIINGHRQKSWIFKAGRGRGGLNRVGGITWCDFSQEFKPITGLHQIFGHTPQHVNPKWCHQNPKKEITYYSSDFWSPNSGALKAVDQSYNLCLDVRGNIHWAIWNGDKLSIFNYKDDL